MGCLVGRGGGGWVTTKRDSIERSFVFFWFVSERGNARVWLVGVGKSGFMARFGFRKVIHLTVSFKRFIIT